AYPDFVETVIQLIPMYWVRAFGGSLYVAGVVLGLVNLLMTWKQRPAQYEEVEHEAPALEPYDGPEPRVIIPAHPTMASFGYRLQYFARATWHRAWERRPLKFTLFVTASVVAASLFEIIPTFL